MHATGHAAHPHMPRCPAAHWQQTAARPDVTLVCVGHSAIAAGPHPAGWTAFVLAIELSGMPVSCPPQRYVLLMYLGFGLHFTPLSLQVSIAESPRRPHADNGWSNNVAASLGILHSAAAARNLALGRASRDAGSVAAHSCCRLPWPASYCAGLRQAHLNMVVSSYQHVTGCAEELATNFGGRLVLEDGSDGALRGASPEVEATLEAAAAVNPFAAASRMVAGLRRTSLSSERLWRAVLFLAAHVWLTCKPAGEASLSAAPILQAAALRFRTRSLSTRRPRSDQVGGSVLSLLSGHLLPFHSLPQHVLSSCFADDRNGSGVVDGTPSRPVNGSSLSAAPSSPAPSPSRPSSGLVRCGSLKRELGIPQLEAAASLRRAVSCCPDVGSDGADNGAGGPSAA
jgi:hypothetical protein